MIQGGGSHSHPGIRVYILLAVRGINSPDVQAIAERFKKTAKHTNINIGGEVVDLDADHRLERELTRTDAGKELYDRIYTSVPVICVSSSFIGDTASTASVELLKFSDYTTNPEAIFDLIESKMTTAEERSGFIEFLKFLNEIVLLRPALFGMDIDLNKILSRLLAKQHRG